MMSVSPSEANPIEYRSPLSALTRVWIGVGVVSWAVALALTTDTPLSGAESVLWTLVAVLVLAATVFALGERFHGQPAPTVYGAIAIALGGWAALMFHDDRWSILSFALFSMCFTKGREVGVALAAVVSGVWLAAAIAGDSPRWTLLIPFLAFAFGAVISMMIYRVGDENEAQAALIAELQRARAELASSERERGTLEERARFAGEVHDTLAQGFTSIVLLSRASRRTGDWERGLADIESTAEENLRAARRLVAAMRPVELDRGGLADALQRQVDTLGDGVMGTFTVEGDPVELDGDTEVALLRAAQEALLNVRTHAQASTVHVTLTYVGSTVVLDVVDDGLGFAPGVVADRGSLSGGQGLTTLRHRAQSLGGELDVEAAQGGGTAVSVRIPVGRP